MEAAIEGGRTRAETNRWLVLVLVCIAQFMVILDATIVNVALPSIQHGLHFTPSSLQWVVNAYTLVFGGFLLLGGRASDLLGRQRLFIAGLIVFTAASLINGIATSSGMLIGGRALQGLGAALVSPAALSIVTTTFAEGAERTKALGIWSSIAAGGGAVGLVLGGAADRVALVALGLLHQPADRHRRGAALPALRRELAGGAAARHGRCRRRLHGDCRSARARVRDRQGAGVWLGLRQDASGSGRSRSCCWRSFVVIELRSKAPLIRLGIFRLRSLSASNIAMLLVASGLFSMFYFAGIYLQEVRGYGPLKAGLAFLPFTFGIVIGAVASQQLITADRHPGGGLRRASRSARSGCCTSRS